MEFKVTIENKEYKIKEGTILSFKKPSVDTRKYIIVNIKKKNILSRYSGYNFLLIDNDNFLNNRPFGNFNESHIIDWLSSNHLGHLTHP
jgi:hypothetical protein